MTAVRIRLFIFVSMCLFLLVGLSAASIAKIAAQVESGSPAVTQDPIDAHISFRKAAGLRSDEAYVASVDATYPVDADWGLPLTPEEQAYMQRDSDVQANLRVIDEYAAVYAPDSFAGLYRDSARLINVGFTEDAEQHLAALKSEFKYPELLRLFHATYPKTQLDETLGRISNDMASLRQEGITIYTAGVNIPENRVDVAVASADPVTVDLLTGRYGPEVRVAAGSQPCTAEAKICPDGSAVGRTGPDCEFAACPETSTQGSEPVAGEKAGEEDQNGGLLAKTWLQVVAAIVSVVLGYLAVYFIRRRMGNRLG